MELREEQVQTVKKSEEEEEKNVLDTLALFGGIIVGQFQSKRKGNQDVKQLTETAMLK